MHHLVAIQSTYPHMELSAFIARLDLEDVKGAWVACGGLHLKDICRHTAARGEVHVPEQDGEGVVLACKVLSQTHALTVKRQEKWVPLDQELSP